MAKGKQIRKKTEAGLVDAVHDLFFGKQDPDERLLRQRNAKRRGFRGHSYAYASVNIGLFLLNLLIVMMTDAAFLNMPFSLIVAIGWGVGLGIHGLNYRAWMLDHEDDILAAELRLGLVPEARQLPSKAKQGASERGVASETAQGVPITDPRWSTLLQRGRRAVDRASHSLETVGVEQGGVELLAHLKRGLEDIERLAAGAARIGDAVSEIAKGGLSALDQELESLDLRISHADDPRLKEVLLANRAHLKARQAKVRALRSEVERMYASAEGFILAADNVRLDAARLGVGQTPELGGTLTGPAERLGEEVLILRRVEAELERY